MKYRRTLSILSGIVKSSTIFLFFLGSLISWLDSKCKSKLVFDVVAEKYFSISIFWHSRHWRTLKSWLLVSVLVVSLKYERVIISEIGFVFIFDSDACVSVDWFEIV